MSEIGFVHSFESFSAVDGPGIRVVVFLQGCVNGCIYCHNPDTWAIGCGRRIEAKELAEKIEEYRGYIRSGGVTLSGGEPFLQPFFSEELLIRCKENGFHTAVESSGSVDLKVAESVLEETDLLILDLKALRQKDCEKVCGIDINKSIEILKYCEEEKKPVWVRHVLVPGVNLDYEKLEEMAEFLKKFKTIKRVELLPFHKMGEYKWEELSIPYTLKNTKTPTENEMEKAFEIFRRYGFVM